MSVLHRDLVWGVLGTINACTILLAESTLLRGCALIAYTVCLYGWTTSGEGDD